MIILPTPQDLGRANDDRVAQLRREIHPHVARPRRSVRRWVGRHLVRVGTRLAAEPTLKPARYP